MGEPGLTPSESDEDELHKGAEVNCTHVPGPAPHAQEIPRVAPDKHRIERGLASLMLWRDSKGQTQSAL